MPSRDTNSGLTITIKPLESRPRVMSTTKIRSGMPICVAASPIPGAAYIVSTISAMIEAISEVTASTGRATSCRIWSPYLRIGRIILSWPRVAATKRTQSSQRPQSSQNSFWEAVHNSLDAVLNQPFDVEINQQSYFTACEPQVRRQLAAMNWFNSFHGLDL